MVEDEALIAMNLSALVEDLGGGVINIATSADQVVGLAGVHMPDVFLMDIRLQDHDPTLNPSIEALPICRSCPDIATAVQREL